ncbi:MAG: N-acetyltransferase family protein [Ignavibacteriales bacterium]
MPETRIRPVKAEDAEAANEIRRQAGVMEHILALPSERVTDSRKFLENLGPTDHVFVAESEGRVVGMAALQVAAGRRRHTGGVGLMVHRDYHGQGIGRRLMDEILDVADNWLGLVRVELEVFADNGRAISLYESLGFQTEGRKRKGALRRGEFVDILIMGRVK